MANHCINTNSKEFKDLLSNTGINPVKLAANIANWQEDNNVYDFPTSEQISDYTSDNTLTDINKLFELNPQLSTIGTKEQYRDYLSNIFPDSTMPILYKGLRNKSSIVHDTPNHSFYTTDFNIADKLYKDERGIKMFKSNAISSQFFSVDRSLKVSAAKREEETFINNSDVDAVVLDTNDLGGRQNQYVINKDVEIKELGSEQDVNDFKSFVNSKQSNDLRRESIFSAHTSRHVNKLLAYITLENYDDLSKLTLGDIHNLKDTKDISSEINTKLNTTEEEEQDDNPTSLKAIILKEFKILNELRYDDNRTPSDDETALVKDIYDELLRPDSILWDNFINFFSSIYKFNITDVDSFLESQTFEELPQMFDDTRQLKQNRTDNISSKIKFLLSKVSKFDSEGSAFSTATGLPEIVDYDVLLNRLINAHINDRTRDDFLNTLETVRDSEYPGLDDLIDDLTINEGDNADTIRYKQDLLNGYITSLNYDMAYVYNVVVTNINDLKVFDILDQNRSSFVSKLDYDTWIENVNINLKSNKLKWLEKGGNNIPDLLQRITKKGKTDIRNAAKYTTNEFIDVPYKHTTHGNSDKFDEKNKEHLEKLATTLNNIGIDIKGDSLISLYDSYKNKYAKTNDKGEVIYEGNNEFITDVLNPIKFIIFDVATSRAMNNYADYSYSKYTTQKSAILKLAEINSKFSRVRTTLDYLDVNNNTNYTPIYHSYLSRLFKGLNTTQNVYNSFYKFTEDAKFQYSNILWSNDKDGIFKYDREGNIKLIRDQDKVDFKFINQLEYKFFNGIKSLTDNIGLKYSDIMNNNWDLVQFLASRDNHYFIPSSDAGRIASVKIPFNYTNFSDSITIDNGRVSHINTNSDIFKAVKNTILQELTEMRKLTSIMFTVDKNNKLKTRSGIAKKLTTLGHPIKHYKKVNGKNTYLDKQYPTGKAFQFNNLTYRTVENGKVTVHSLNDILNTSEHLTEAKKSDSTDRAINQFIQAALKANIEEHLSNYSNISDTIGNYVRETRKNYTSQKERTKDLASKVEYKDKTKLNNDLAEYYVKNYIAQVEIQNFINGNVNEYESQVKYNKRINESIKNGISPVTDTKYSVVHVNDIVRDTPFKEVIDAIKANQSNVYEGIESTDGLSIITLEEFKRRSLQFGRRDYYDEILEKLENADTPLDAANITRFVESQKYFYYDRELDYTLDENNPEILSKQYKDSTIVLSDRMVKGLQLEALRDYMNEHSIDQISFGTASKVGSINPITLFDSNGNFNPEIDDTNTLDTYKSYAQHADLVVQLDLPSHTLNHSNKIGVQLEKTIMTNILDATTYRIDGEPIEGSKLKVHYDRLIKANIEQSAYDLLREFDAVENNEIKYDDQGNIDVNYPKFIKFLKDYVRDNESDRALNEILATSENDGNTNLPIYNGLSLNKLKSILLALPTNRVVNQRISGAHAALVPEFGLNPRDLSYLSPDKIMEYKEVDKAIDWSDEVYEQIKSGKRKDFKLQINTSTDSKGNVTQLAEVVMSPWLKKFYKEGEQISINDLTDKARESFGIRIPTEGKQSTVYFKVVGFLKTGTSQVIAPLEFVSKTGWDYDIDTLYAYMKEVELNSDGQYDATKYLTNKDNIKARYNAYINNTKVGKNIKLKYFNEVKSINDKISKEYDKLNEIIASNAGLTTDSYNKGVEYLGNLYSYRADLNAMVVDEYFDNNKDNAIQLQSEIKEVSNKIQLVEDRLGYTKQQIKELNRSVKTTVKTKYETERQYINDKINEELESQISLEDFSNLSIEKQNTRAARNNRLISIYGGIVNNSSNIDEYYKPNDMSHIEQVSKYINNLWGYNLEGLNINNTFDAAIFRNLNMSVRSLKGNSVAWDGIMNIFSRAGAKGDPIRYTIETENLPTTDIKELNKIFDDVHDNEDGTYSITTRAFATNDKGIGTDITGDKITNQTSEVTANILDAVSNVMGFNINTHTLGVFKLLSGNAFSALHNGESNHFKIPYLFTHQPVIVELARRFTTAQAEDINAKISKVNDDILLEYELAYYDLIFDKLAKLFKGGRYHPVMKRVRSAIDRSKPIKLNEIEGKEFTNAVDEYKSNAYTNHTYVKSYNGIPSVKVLEENIKYKQYDIENLPVGKEEEMLLNQIDILHTFNYYKSIADTVVKSISTFNADKLTVGPSFNNTRTLENNILELALDKESLSLSLTPKDFEKAISTINDTNLPLVEKIEDLKLIDSKIFKDNPILTDAKGNNLVVEIYKELFYGGEGITAMSAYYTYAHELSNKLIKPHFPHENGLTYKLKTDILNTPALRKTEYLERLVDNYINTVATKDIAFFTTTDNYDLMESISDDPNNTKSTEFTIAKIKNKVFGKGVGLDHYSDRASKDYINIDNPTNEDRRKFNLLTLEDRILLLQSSDTFDKVFSHTIYQDNHIISNTTDSSRIISKDTGFYSFKINNAIDADYARDSIYHMFSGKTVFEGKQLLNKNQADMLKHVVKDMIRNHIWSSGYTFSKNITRYIPIDLLHENYMYNNDEGMTLNEKGQLAQNELGLFGYSSALFKLKDGEYESIYGDAYTAFFKANWQNSTLVPSAKTIPDNAGSAQYPAFVIEGNLTQNSDMNIPSNHLIIELTSAVMKSKYRNNTFVKVDNGGHTVLYKRFDFEENGITYYYPITRTLPHEFNSTFVNEYKTIEGGENPAYIKSEETYLRDITEEESSFDNTDDSTEIDNINDNNIRESKQSNNLYTGKQSNNLSWESKVNRLALDYNINNKGFFSEKVFYDKLKSDAYKLGLGIKQTSNKRGYYLTRDGKMYKPSIIYRYGKQSNSLNTFKYVNTEERFEGSKQSKLKSLKESLGNSIHIGSDDSLYNTPINYGNHLSVNIEDDTSKIAKKLARYVNKVDSEDILIVGDRESKHTQEEINGKISAILKYVTLHANGFPRFHTIVAPGVNEAVINNVHNYIVRSYRQSNDNYKIREGKQSGNLVDESKLQYSGEHNDINYINNQVNILVDSIKDLLNYQSLYANEELGYKDKLHNLEQQVLYSNELTDLGKRDVNAIKTALDYNIQILGGDPNTDDSTGSMKAQLLQLSDELKTVNFNKIREYSVEKRTDIAGKVRHILHLAKRFDFIDDINTLGETRADSESIAEINEKINELKAIKTEVNAAAQNALGFTSHFLQSLFHMYAANPEYKTVLSRTLQALDKDGKFNNSKFEESEMTPEEVYEQFQRLLTQNESMSAATLNMDSVMNTGVEIVDTVLKSYVSLRSEKNLRVNDYTDRLSKLISDYFGTSAEISLRNNQQEIEDGFAKFIDKENGTLRDKYNWGMFYASRLKAFDQADIQESNAKAQDAKLNGLNNKLEELENNEGTQAEIDSIKDEIQETRDKYFKYKAKAKAIKNEWTDKNTIDDIDAVSLTEAEQAKLDYVLKSYDDKIIKKFVRNKHYHKRKIKGAYRYVKVIPTDTFIDNQYKQFSDKDIKFLEDFKTLILDITNQFPHLIIEDNFLPIGIKQGVGRAVKQALGVKNISNDNIEESLDEELVVQRDVPMTTNFLRNREMFYPKKEVGQTVGDYEKEVVKYINDKYKKADFKSIKEIEDYNANIRKVNEDHTRRYRNYNPVSLMSQFIYYTNEHRHMSDFENYLQPLLTVLGSEDYKEIHTRSKSLRVLDKVSTKLTGEKIYQTRSGKDTNSYKRVVKALNSFYNISNVSTTGEQIASVAKSFTSMTYMGLNLLGAVKNIMTGFQNELMESHAKQFLEHKHLAQAVKDYRGSIQAILKTLTHEYTDNLTAALIKDGHDLLELRDNAEQNINSKNNEARLFASLNNALYYGNNAGEHFMQYTMMIGMMRSHRVINNRTISFEQYKWGKEEEVIYSILNDSQIEQYNDFKDKVKKRKSKPNKLYDIPREFMTNNQNTSLKDRQEFVKATNKLDKDLKAEFETHPTVYDQWEVKDGRAKLKKDAVINYEQYQQFLEKVRKVNHSLHGVYDQLNKMALRNRAYWDLAFQFRSWLKPNWDRHFGKKFWRSSYNEGLETYQKGIFASLFGTFLHTPFKLVKEYGSNQTGWDIFVAAMKQYGSFFAHARTYYGMLNDIDKANVNRAAMNMLNIMGTTALLVILGNLIPDDEEGENVDNVMLALAIYELNSYHSEITQFMPIIGQYAFYSRTKENPIAAQRVAYELWKTARYAIQTPLGVGDITYQRGPYKGRTKLEVQLGKVVPIYRQKHKWDNLGMYTGWYRMHNPLNVFDI